LYGVTSFLLCFFILFSRNGRKLSKLTCCINKNQLARELNVDCCTIDTYWLWYKYEPKNIIYTYNKNDRFVKEFCNIYEREMKEI
ncbi:hypothetical protein, partial [Bacillus pseudomycoides]|uniref:hypothetical protein n=1 Tax=Bacillus pseudomycoides TaxID=64104 RepID=UPI002FFE6B04